MEAANQADECEIAYSNPKCPYVTQINFNMNSMRNVDKTLTALMGSDGTGLNEGVIHKILTKLETLEKAPKPCPDKAKLSGKDKALIIGSFLTAFSLVAVELIRAIFHVG